MFMLNRKKNKWKKVVGITLGAVVAAHVVAGVLLCTGIPHCDSWNRMARKAKRTVVGLVRELV